MQDKGYFLEIGEKGEERLDVLNSLTNDSSQTFLKKMGLKAGMTVLELGCGAGQMSVWLAKEVQPNGRVIAVDSSGEQIRLAKAMAAKEGIDNIDFQVVSAYDLDSLDLENQLDFVFSRFVFIHLIDHRSVLNTIQTLLKPGSGVVVIQDLIASHIFSYPESQVVDEWLALALKIYAHYGKDPDFGKRLLPFYLDVGLRILDYEYFHPLLKTEYEKLQMARGTLECEKFLLEHGLSTRETIDLLVQKLKEEAKNEGAIISFMPNIIVAGIRAPF
ncbi:MAG: methyltransferase domain-containing protein [Chlamydiales bacterium]